MKMSQFSLNGEDDVLVCVKDSLGCKTQYHVRTAVHTMVYEMDINLKWVLIKARHN